MKKYDAMSIDGVRDFEYGRSLAYRSVHIYDGAAEPNLELPTTVQEIRVGCCQNVILATPPLPGWLGFLFYFILHILLSSPGAAFGPLTLRRKTY